MSSDERATGHANVSATVITFVVDVYRPSELDESDFEVVVDEVEAALGEDANVETVFVGQRFAEMYADYEMTSGDIEKMTAAIEAKIDAIVYGAIMFNEAEEAADADE